MSYDYEKTASIREAWGDALGAGIIGRRVTSVRYLTTDEAREIGWTESSVVITFDNGVSVYPSRDDEGNGAGALFTTINGLETIPVIRG